LQNPAIALGFPNVLFFLPTTQRREKSMNVLALSAPRTRHESDLLKRHHQLRAQVFSGRLGWEVKVEAGFESDEFDALSPTYILATAREDRLAGAARLLPAVGPTMIANVFPSLLPNGHLNAHAAMVESSRFCVDTSLAEGRGEGSVHEATLSMFAGIVEWCVVNSFSEIVTVTDLRFERILARVGWPLKRLAEPKRLGVTMAVAGLLPADTATFQMLRPSNYHSDFHPTGKAA
jgi:acyl homoserine lactone synthase